jgi:hypothetical protein
VRFCELPDLDGMLELMAQNIVGGRWSWVGEVDPDKGQVSVIKRSSWAHWITPNHVSGPCTYPCYSLLAALLRERHLKASER